MEKTNLEMIRGDTLSFAFEVEYDEALQKLDSAYFTCKENFDDDAPIFKKSLGHGITLAKQEDGKLYYVVRVAPEDTESVEPGLYYYDLQIGINGDVFSILIGSLKIHNDVTKVTAIKPIETGGFSNEIVTFSQENETAKAFVETAEKTYKDGDDYSSILGNYSTSFPSYYQYPIGYDLTIPQAGTLLIQNESTGKGFESVSVSAGTKTIYNLIPGVTYRYILRDSNGKAYKTGRLQSTGALRMIKVPNSWNFRDLGGWACNGGTVKYGLLLRGGPLTGGTPISDYTTDEGKRAIRDFGILQEIDLRSTGEINNGTTDTADDIVSCAAGKYIRYSRYSPGADIKTNEDSSKTLAEIINVIMQNVIDGIPTYFHCSAGADRTGVIAILLEALLGVSVVDIQIDYELTYFYTNRTRSTKKADIEYLKSFSGKHSGIDWKTAVWATKYGISIDKINAFRAMAIDGTPETLSVPTEFAITQQPTDATVSRGSSVTETIVANGDGLTYLWEYRTSSSGDWGSVANLGLTATGTSITIGNLQTAYTGYQLRCTVTDQYGNSAMSNIATLTVVEYAYTITNNLTNCTSSNSATSIAKGSAYSANITPNSGYQINSLTVTMGGKDITSTAVSGGKINISEITGDIIIFCNATKIDQGLVSTSLATDLSIYNGIGYKNGVYLSGTDEHTDASVTTIGWIKIDEDSISNTWTVTGADSSSYAASHSRINVGGANNNDASITLLTQQNGLSGNKAGFNFTTLDDGSLQMTQTTKLANSFHSYDNYYFRLCFANTDGENVSITKG